jgi:hypothetical protein
MPVSFYIAGAVRRFEAAAALQRGFVVAKNLEEYNRVRHPISSLR